MFVNSREVIKQSRDLTFQQIAQINQEIVQEAQAAKNYELNNHKYKSHSGRLDASTFVVSQGNLENFHVDIEITASYAQKIYQAGLMVIDQAVEIMTTKIEDFARKL